MAADSAAAGARDSERSRFDALIHDRVIATLVAANGQHTDARLPEQAQQALAELSALAESGDGEHQLTAAEAVARLRTAVTTIDADIPIGVVEDEDGDEGGDEGDGLDRAAAGYPEAVVRALAEALGEALRNSLRHAGPDADRLVLIEVSAARLQVSVGDNGVGFDVTAVPPERLGIAVSIHGRIDDLPGGWAEVTSTPGRGTTVRLGWAE